MFLLSRAKYFSRHTDGKIDFRLHFRKKNSFLNKLQTSISKYSNGCACDCPKDTINEKQTSRHRFLNEIFDMNCKVAVVVGGEGGIGYAAAHEILSNKAKAVAIFGNNVCKGMEACHALNCRFGKRKAVFFQVDVTKEEDINCSICKLEEQFGIIQAFVNSFAICDGKNWEKELSINLIGMARSTIAAHNYLTCTKKGGVIVNTAGIFGLLPSAGSPTLSAAQHGIIGLSKSFGKETLFKHTNVRVLTLCPGIVETKLYQNPKNKAINSFMGERFEEEISSLKKQRPEVCGNAIMWLIRYGFSGSLWMLDGNDLYKIHSTEMENNRELYYNFPG